LAQKFMVILVTALKNAQLLHALECKIRFLLSK
jgi:hypothetical protein